ncbi:unnamed protein product [Camellia sinensis]
MLIRGWNKGRTKVVLLSKGRPLLELFRCDDMVTQEGDWWFFQPQIEMLEHKISLPVGSCNLALPLWGKMGPTNYLFNPISEGSASPTTSTLSAAAVLPSLQCILQQNNMQRGIVGMKVLNPYGPCPVASHPRFLNAITVVALEGLNSG